jgi:hypothetical protein
MGTQCSRLQTKDAATRRHSLPAKQFTRSETVATDENSTGSNSLTSDLVRTTVKPTR